jgi:hypothetical protein
MASRISYGPVSKEVPKVKQYERGSPESGYALVIIIAHQDVMTGSVL